MGSKNFTEQQILGEIIAQHLEHRIRTPIRRTPGLGGTLLAQQALLTKEIDLYPEYTGTAYTNVLKNEPKADAAAVLEEVRMQYAKRMNLSWLDPLGLDNSFAMVVRAEDAEKRRLKTLSDAAKDPAGFVLGAGYEFDTRPDGYRLLNANYNIQWKGSPKTMELGLLYQALKSRQVDMIAGSATDGALIAVNGKILEDDKHIFPPYQACIVARTDTLESTPGLKAALAELSNKISTDAMRRMNYEVDAQHRKAAEVAAEFLRQNGL